MGFSFGFTEDMDEDLVGSENQDLNTKYATNPIDDNQSPLAPPQLITMSSLLQRLEDVRISYEVVDIEGDKDDLSVFGKIYKRELYDVKHQLMMEDYGSQLLTEGDDENSEEFKVLIGETDEDLKKGVYEGGLKSWECSFDVIKKLQNLNVNQMFGSSAQGNGSEDLNIVELGCGTSLPSLYLFKNLLQLRSMGQLNHYKKLKFVLSDYNYPVLRLVTLPNLLITFVNNFVKSEEELIELQASEEQEGIVRDGELLITSRVIKFFEDWLLQMNIEITFISGNWNRSFMQQLNSQIDIGNSDNIIITSETIYSPDILPIITEMLLELSRDFKDTHQNLCLLAAKDIYFGVGGSVNEVLECLQNRIKVVAEYKDIHYEIGKVNANLKRSLIRFSR